MVDPRTIIAVLLGLLAAGCTGARQVCAGGMSPVTGECLVALPDAGSPDAGAPDSGTPDAGAADAGASDGGPADAGLSSATDAGDDAGPRPSEACCSGLTPAHNYAQDNDAVASPLTLRWRFDYDAGPGGEGSVGSPLIADGKAVFYWGSGNQVATLQARDLETGALVWSGVPGVGLLTLGSGDLFGFDGEHLIALSLEDGGTQWSADLGRSSQGAALLADDGLVFVSRSNGAATVLTAFDAQSGAQRWQAQTGHGGDGALASADGSLYELETCEQIGAFDAASGAMRWTHPGTCTGGGEPAASIYQWRIFDYESPDEFNITTSGTATPQLAWPEPPALHGGTMFFIDDDEVSIDAVDLETGALRWKFTAPSYAYIGQPVVAGRGGQVFVASSAGILYELDEATGAQRSSASIGPCGTQCNSQLTLAGGHLIVNVYSALLAY